MVGEILSGLLWRSRLTLRAGSLRAFGGHGYVDPSYRPPALPYVSVVGPLSLAVEPERENGKPGHALVSIPGHIIGAARPPSLVPPSSGTLRLRFNRRATVTLALAGLPATSFGDPATGAAIAAAVQQAITDAVTTGQVLDDAGDPIADPAVLTAVGAATVRWAHELRQLAISSDSVTEKSAVEIIPVADDLSPSLGFAPPALSREGRRHLHKLPPPKSVTVEVRLDLWASSQGDLASMFEGLAVAAPTRGKLVVRPSLLAADVADGATSIRLLERGEPTTPESLVHLEGGDGLVERTRGAAFAETAPAAHEPAERRFRITGSGRITGTVYRAPLVPDALFSTDPAPLGLAAAIGIALDPGAAENDVIRLFSLTRGAANALAVEIRIEQLPSGQPPEPTLFGRVVATATMRRGLTEIPIETHWRIPLASLQAGGTLHVQVTCESGSIQLWFEGAAQRLDDAFTSPVAPIVAGPSRTSAGTDLVVELGAPVAQPVPFSITHFHLHREPVGPIDPRLRTSVARADQLRPGDVIALASSDDGWQLGDARGLSLVVASTGDEVALAKPIVGAFPRGRALVFQDECFFFQTALKRRDDLMNRLYHCAVDYKVSALLEEPTARTSAPLVLTTREDITTRKPTPISDRGGPPPAKQGTGTAAVDHEAPAEPSHEVH